MKINSLHLVTFSCIINFVDPTGVVAPQCLKICTDHAYYSFHLIHRVSDILSWNASF